MIEDMEQGHSEPARAHSHAHTPLDYGRAFTIGIALNLVYVVGEAIAGVISGSLALIADAGHNLSDVLALALSWGAAVLSRRRPSDRFTYGLRSSSILAAFANAMILLVVTGGIAWEAWWRITQPAPVASTIVIWVAATGILVNGSPRFSLPRGASATSISKALSCTWPPTRWSRPALSRPGSQSADRLAMARSGGEPCRLGRNRHRHMGLVKSAIGLALDAVPEGVDAAAVRAYLLSVSGVTGLHDLHIWGMSTTETALTCHLVMPDGHPGDAMLGAIAERLHHRFGIHHATIQIELADTDEACVLTPEHVV